MNSPTIRHMTIYIKHLAVHWNLFIKEPKSTIVQHKLTKLRIKLWKIL